MNGTANDGDRRSRDAATIGLDGVQKVYPGGTIAVGSLTLEVAAGELVVLVGPSGCGKSTILRMVNRLVQPSAGRIYLAGEDVTDVDPVALRRRIGYVIQHVGLFPHHNVRDNVATVPRLLGWSRSEVNQRVEELLGLVGLEAGRYARRYPHELSGGERQRVGVARALAADPVVLLMDEPFSAVDPIARSRLQDEFGRLQATLGKTVLFVTHDVDEAVRLGDRIAVLSDGGTLEQYDEPATLLAKPANDFVAEFLGSDRGVKRLGVIPIPRVLAPVPDDGGVSTAVVESTGTLRDALAAMVEAGADWVAVRGPDGTILGALTLPDLVAPTRSADPSRFR